MPNKGRSLPDDLFHVVTALFPELIHISEASNINAVELFTLWCLKHRGTKDDMGQAVLLRSDITKLLGREIGFSAGAIDQHVNRLEEKNLLFDDGSPR